MSDVTLSSWPSAGSSQVERLAEDPRGVLVLPEAAIREAARRRAATRSILGIVVRQAVQETLVRHWRRIQFRVRRNDDACQAYCAMNTSEFEGINARQCWANWRTIPRNLHGRAPDRPLRAVDLCCGVGQSTEVLAHYLAPGSSILGLEFNPRFVERARQRRYLTRCGRAAQVSFHAQSVLATFRSESGAALASRSVDLVHSSGAVGCHFDPPATAALAAEVDRVLAPGGLALIDSGPAGTSREDVEAIFALRGFEVLHRARSCRLDRYTQVCLRKTDGAAAD